MDRAQLEERILSRRRTGRGPQPEPPEIPPADRSDPLPLSCGQERFWLVNRFALGGRMAEAGNCAFWFRLRGALDEPALRSAIAAVHGRHEILRTIIRPGSPHDRQVVRPPGPVPLATERIGPAASATEDQLTGAALRRARELAAEPFDLAVDLPVRWSLLRLAETDHVLLLRIHHIACDGWSEAILFGELAELYSAYARDEQPRLPPLPVQYADFACWQRRRLGNGELAGQLDYFRAALADAPAATMLPGDPVPGEDQLAPGAVAELPLSPAAEAAAQQLTSTSGTTLFMVLLAAYSALLHRHTGQTDLVVGAPVAGRNRPELAGLVGFFVNTVPIRIDLSDDPGFDELLRRVREAALGALANQELPFEVLVEALGVPRLPGRPPLVQTMLQVHNTPSAQFDFTGLQAELRQIFTASAALDLTASFLADGSGLRALWEYRVDLFTAGRIEQLHRELDQLLIRASAAPTTRLSDLPLLDDDQLRTLRRWSTGAVPASEPTDVIELFDSAAARTPDAVAVQAGDQTVSYAELNARSDHLARLLLDLPVRPDDLVGICLPRGVAAVTAILAVLKAGAGYLPIDPDYPVARRQFMIDDAGLSALLSGNELLADLVVGQTPVIELSQDAGSISAGSISAGSGGRVRVPVRPDGQAYVIYTSGSTGVPKGAAVTRGGLANYLRWAAEHYRGEHPPDAVLHSPLSFDLTVTSLFVPLISGGCIRVIADQQPLPALDGLLSDPDMAIGLLKMTPAHLRSLLPVHRDAGRLATVGSFVIGGEALPSELAGHWQRLAPGAAIFNEYGPTETVVGCAVHRYDPTAEPALPSVPIGRPIDNTQLYVLDRFGNQVAAGWVGELYIGGDGVCRGYPGRPGLTAERFVPDHLGGRPGGRLYRTGDLARWDESGVLHFLGRADDQVKVRGYRIELAELDQALRSCPGVADAVTEFRRDPDRLIGYYTCLAGQRVDPCDVQAALAAALPAEMLPDRLQPMDRLPLTANGKVDRAALPEPDALPAASGYQAPGNQIEATVCRIFATVLGVEQVGLDDNFFALGGHSMQAAKAVAEVAASWPLLPGAGLLRALFAGPTARRLSGYLLDLMCRVCSTPAMSDSLSAQANELSDVKRGLYFLQQLQPSSTEFLVPIAVELHGRCDRDALLAALGQLPARHPALRSRFELTDAGPRQLIDPAVPLPVRQDDLRGLDDGQLSDRVAELLAEELSRPIDLATGPLVRARVAWLAPERHLLLVVTHHIVTDGLANLALLADLGQLYATGGVTDEPPATSLGQPAIPPDPAVREQDLHYWLQTLAGLPELDLPTDRPRPAVRTGRGATVAGRLDSAVADRLDQLARRQATTEFVVLLAAAALLMAELSGQHDFALGTSSVLGGMTRPAGQVDVSIDQVPLRMDVSGSPTFAELLDRTRDRCRESLAHHGVSFVDIVQAVAPERDLSRTPLFTVAVELALPEPPADLFPGLRLTELPVATPVAKYDLSFIFRRDEHGLELVLEYSVDLYDRATAEQIAADLIALLTDAVGQPDRPVTELASRPTARPGIDRTGIDRTGAEQSNTEQAAPGRLDSGQAEPEQPDGELTVLLRDTWAELLGLDGVGIDEDFFQLGGDSLLALRLISILRRRLATSELPLELVFRFPTVRALVPEVERLLLAEIDQLSDDEVVDALRSP